MKKAVPEYLVEEGRSRLAQHILDPVSGGEHRGSVIDMDAVNPL